MKGNINPDKTVTQGAESHGVNVDVQIPAKNIALQVLHHHHLLELIDLLGSAISDVNEEQVLLINFQSSSLNICPLFLHHLDEGTIHDSRINLQFEAEVI